MTTPLFQGFAAIALLAVAGAGAQAATIAAGSSHTLALSSDGSVLAWGDNREGQLGQGSPTTGTVPVPTTLVTVRASDSSVMALDSSGNLWTWGRNTRGLLGDGTTVDRSQPRIVLRNIVHFDQQFLAVDAAGKVWQWGDDVLTPTATTYPVRIVKAFQAHRTLMAIDEAGGVWGSRSGGPCVFTDSQQSTFRAEPIKIPGLPPIRELRFGRDTFINPEISFTAGAQSVTAVDSQGASWSWGRLDGAQPNCLPRKGLEITPAEQGYALTPAGKVLGQYDIDSNAPAPVELLLLQKLAAVQRLSITTTHGHALTASGDLWQWPRAAEAQADDGSGTLLKKIATGVTDMSAYGLTAPHVMYTTANGQLQALGSSFDLQLGLGVEIAPRSSPVRVPGLSSVTSVLATGDTAIAFTQDGKVYAWGLAPLWNPITQKLEATRQPKPLPIPLPVRSLSMHSFTMLVIDGDGTAWHWGTPVGVNKPLGSDFRPATKVALGNAAAKISSISKDNALILDTDGNIWGLGTFSTPSGSANYTQPFQQPSVPAAQQVVALGTASLALDNSGAVWAWGTDVTGSLWNNMPIGQYMPPTRLLTGKAATSIHGGDGHFCAVLVDGTAQCHGRKLGGSAGKVFRLHAAIKEVALSGGNPSRQPGNVYFRLADGTVWAHGEGPQGQLGVGTYGSVLEPAPVNDPSGTADLDLDPATPTATPPAGRPPFRVQTTYSGGLGQLTLSGTVFGGPTTASAPDGKYNVYVVAVASDGPGGPPTTWFQRDDKGQWSPVQWPMPAYAIKADLGSANLSVPLDIFRNFPAQGLQNSRVYVGYGLDAYEMLDAGRLREVLMMADD